MPANEPACYESVSSDELGPEYADWYDSCEDLYGRPMLNSFGPIDPNDDIKF